MPSSCPQNYNSKVLVELWTDFIDWEKRRKGEKGFLVKQLKKFNCRKVFDACFGDGADSIYLIKEGFDVASNDLDRVFIEKALKNAEAAGVRLNVSEIDWLDLDKHFKKESFDAILCLGNSLTCLFERREQLKALKNFQGLLRKGGILVIDERNYPEILEKRKEILEEGKFSYSGKFVYCGDKVHGKPVEISENKIKMPYRDERTGKAGHLILYPFKRNELRVLLKEAGFKKIEKFSDYQKEKNSSADFYQYLCLK